MSLFTDVIDKLAHREDLTDPEMRGVMEHLLEGEVSAEQTAAFLMGLRTKGETASELAEAVRVMREASVSVEVNVSGAVDLCGTGGDRSGTFNISTAAMFVVAGAGVPVLKHGNRSVSSKSGSFDVLEALGAEVMLGKRAVEKMFRETGIACMFAPLFHPALKYVMPVRRALGVRTFFNILGPLLNPACVRRQLIGAFDADVARRMMEISRELGDAKHVITLSAEDGLDELSTTCSTTLFEYARDGLGGLGGGDGRDGRDERSELSGGDGRDELGGLGGRRTLNPEDLGYQKTTMDALKGGDAVENARILMAVLKGTSTRAQREITELNAAFGIYCSGVVGSVEEAQAMARESIDSGAAVEKLSRFVALSKTLGDG